MMLAEIARAIAMANSEEVFHAELRSAPGEAEAGLPDPDVWRSYSIAPDVVVIVRAEAGPWRTKRILSALRRFRITGRGFSVSSDLFRFPFTLAPTYHARARAAEVAPGVGEIELPADEFGDVVLPHSGSAQASRI